MKKFLLPFVVTIIALSLLVVPSGFLVADPADLIVNGDFQTGDLTGWDCVIDHEGTTYGGVIEEPSVSGNYVLHVDNINLDYPLLAAQENIGGNNGLEYNYNFKIKPIDWDNSGVINVTVTLKNSLIDNAEWVSRKEFLSSSGLVLGQWNSFSYLLSEFYNSNKSNPADPDFAAIDFDKISVTVTAQDIEAYFDDFYLAAIPPNPAGPAPLSPQDWVLKDLNIGELVALYGPTSEGLVKMLYDTILGRIPDADGEAYWAGQLNSGVFTGSQLVEHFIFSDELSERINAMGNEEFITFLYNSFLSRNPDSEGFNSWVGYMNSGVSKLDTLRAFMDNQEWFDICSMFNVVP